MQSLLMTSICSSWAGDPEETQITVIVPLAFANRPVPPVIVTRAVSTGSRPVSTKVPVTLSPLAATIVTVPLPVTVPSPENVLTPCRLRVCFPRWLMTPDSSPVRAPVAVLMLIVPLLWPRMGLLPATVAVLLSRLTRTCSCTGPELCTIPVCGSAVDVGSEVDVTVVSVELVAVGDDGEFPGDEFELDEDLDPDDELELDDELDDEFDEPESEGLADATHGVAASPAPMPRATANAPIRPILLAYPMVVPP